MRSFAEIRGRNKIRSLQQQRILSAFSSLDPNNRFVWKERFTLLVGQPRAGGRSDPWRWRMDEEQWMVG